MITGHETVHFNGFYAEEVEYWGMSIRQCELLIFNENLLFEKPDLSGPDCVVIARNRLYIVIR